MPQRQDVYIVSAFETVEGREVMDSSRVLSWLQGGSKVMEREEPGCGKQEPGMTRLTTRHGAGASHQAGDTPQVHPRGEGEDSH